MMLAKTSWCSATTVPAISVCDCAFRSTLDNCSQLSTLSFPPIFFRTHGRIQTYVPSSVSISASHQIELTKRLENKGHDLGVGARLGQSGDLLCSVRTDIEIDDLSNNLREQRSGGNDRRQ